MIHKMPIIIGIILTISIAYGQILDNIPITFELKGATAYTPDIGGSQILGYKLKLGYMYKPWLAVEFITTSTKTDVLVLQIDDFYTTSTNPLFSGHQITITDYHKDSNGLQRDIKNDNDISAFSYTNKKKYNLQMTRYQGDNSGQDWNAPLYKYSMTQVCFYTSDNTFNDQTWNTFLRQCYYFEVQNYISTYRGTFLKQFSANGYQMSAFGYIDGPYLTDNLFLYQSAPLYTYVQQAPFVLQIGTTSGHHGQDFQAWSPVVSEIGDYYGTEVTSMVKDNTVNGGFDNKALTAKFWNALPSQFIAQVPTTNLLINFRRNITTFDPYDRNLLSTFSFCMYIYATGSINSDLTNKACQVVELSYHHPRTYLSISSYGINTFYSGIIVVLSIMVLLFN